jgi:hypothetical protein
VAVQFSKDRSVPKGWFNGVTLMNGKAPGVQMVAPPAPENPVVTPEEVNNPYDSGGGPVVDSSAYSPPPMVDVGPMYPAEAPMAPSDAEQAYQVVQSEAEKVPSGVMLWVQLPFFAWLALHKDLPFWARALAGLLGARLVVKNFSIAPKSNLTVSRYARGG